MDGVIAAGKQETETFLCMKKLGYLIVVTMALLSRRHGSDDGIRDIFDAIQDG